LDAVLEIRGLTKLYRGVPAVVDLNFTLAKGEILGYVGPNGSGKSTTVKMLIGLLEPTNGQILFHGSDVHQDLVGFKRRVGYVPEEPHLYAHLLLAIRSSSDFTGGMLRMAKNAV
jgi:ABC-2 type transport system ATP-binding protein